MRNKFKSNNRISNLIDIDYMILGVLVSLAGMILAIILL